MLAGYTEFYMQEKAAPSVAQKLEALLFVYGELLSYKKAMSLLDIKKEELEEAVIQLKGKLSQRESGIELFEHDEALQLVTRPVFAGLLDQVVKAEMSESLTPASLETLAIITYASPVSRAEIDYIRGVNSSYIVRALLMRGLIERTLDSKRSNLFLYAPAADLLKYLGAASASELPDYERLRSVAVRVMKPEEKKEETAGLSTTHSEVSNA